MALTAKILQFVTEFIPYSCAAPPPSSTPSASEGLFEGCRTSTKLMRTAHTVCIDFDGRIYSEGDTWNPYYLGFGRVDCWTCTCVVSTYSHCSDRGIYLLYYTCREASLIVLRTHVPRCRTVSLESPYQTL